MTNIAVLEEIDRIHDEQPERAAEELRRLDTAALPADQLPLAAFLLLHVLGEKLGQWNEAAERLERLRALRADAPLAVAAQAAVAGHLAGPIANPAFEALRAVAGEAAARCLVELGSLELQPPAEIASLAAGLERWATASDALDPAGPLNRRLAIAFNNTTSRLLEQAEAPVAAPARMALLAGSAAALRFWRAAGTWVNHERALYLRALVHNRIGEAAAARADCEQALDIIAANGAEEVDRAFLQLQLAGALISLGDRGEGERRLAEAQAAAGRWDDDGLRSWFAAERDKLFGKQEPGA